MLREMYSEEELEEYGIYMNYVRGLIKETELPNEAKASMIMKPYLQKKNNNEWYLQYKKSGKTYAFHFISFNQWRLQESRDKKLNQLLNE